MNNPLKHHEIIGMSIFTGALPIEAAKTVHIVQTKEKTLIIPLMPKPIRPWDAAFIYSLDHPFEPRQEEIELNVKVDMYDGTIYFGYGPKSNVLAVRWLEREEMSVFDEMKKMVKEDKYSQGMLLPGLTLEEQLDRLLKIMVELKEQGFCPLCGGGGTVPCAGCEDNQQDYFGACARCKGAKAVECPACGGQGNGHKETNLAGLPLWEGVA